MPFLIKETFFLYVWFDDLFLNAIECIMVDKQKKWINLKYYKIPREDEILS